MPQHRKSTDTAAHDRAMPVVTLAEHCSEAADHVAKARLSRVEGLGAGPFEPQGKGRVLAHRILRDGSVRTEVVMYRIFGADNGAAKCR